jgi:hypothetical protein
MAPKFNRYMFMGSMRKDVNTAPISVITQADHFSQVLNVICALCPLFLVVVIGL